MRRMNPDAEENLGLIAGKGVYPLLLAESAKRRGLKRLVAIAFRGETERRLERLADETTWLYIGQFGRMMEALRASGVKRCVMAGQITPTHLFRVRPDAAMIALLKRLKIRNAETIFGAVGEKLREIGIELLPASAFMEDHMPGAGLLTARAPTPVEENDIALGLRVANATSGLDIGQTVVIKEGTVLAVEAFEGTDAAIRRAGKLGGPGAVVVKIAKRGHDMRFDIPVVGMHTLRQLRRARAATLAVEADRCILLERDRLVAEANRRGIAIVAVANAAGEGNAE
ncbi:MAG: LpxI family protein [Lentisphaerae bacterium]|nr:LpxI family protein [Lentisphaerota bacterium]